MLKNYLRAKSRPLLGFRALSFGVIAVFVLATAAIVLSVGRDRAEAIDGGVKDSRNIAVVLAGQIEQTIQAFDNRLLELRIRIGELDADNGLHKLSNHFRKWFVSRICGSLVAPAICRECDTARFL
jgi:hypothetical protein